MLFGIEGSLATAEVAAMSATITRFPEQVPDEALLIDIAQQAVARHLYLVIDRHGKCVLTPQLLPGMQKIHVLDKAAA